MESEVKQVEVKPEAPVEVKPAEVKKRGRRIKYTTPQEREEAIKTYNREYYKSHKKEKQKPEERKRKYKSIEEGIEANRIKSRERARAKREELKKIQV